MLASRHAFSSQRERLVAASTVAALRRALGGTGTHAARCPARTGGRCMDACQRAREALAEARRILWSHP
jgi:hypothetical protein